MIRLFRKPAPASPAPEPVRTPVEEIAHRHGELFGAQAALLPIEAPLTILDGGMHHGESSEKYLQAFPASRIFAFEPAAENLEIAQARLAAFGDRVRMFPYGLADGDGTAELKVNSHDGTHSLLEIGEVAQWDGPATTLERRPIETVALDGFCAAKGLERIDILKLDIQGGELRALKGAEGLLRRRAIRLIAAEVSFVPLYRDSPLFWDVAAWLRTAGYALHGLFDLHHVKDGSGALRWADAIFVPAPDPTTAA
ncbi:MAG: FkbM family methyltransferase [Reyranellaceae bacterium]